MSETSARTGRSMAMLREGLTAWWREREELRDLAVRTVPSGGLSNETLILDWIRDDGTAGGAVVRILAADDGIFPDADLERQGKVQAILADCGLPAARPIAFEADPRWIGAGFLAMERLYGRAYPDFPNYIDEGWVRNLPPQERAHSFRNFVEAVAAIHRVDIDATGLRAIAARPKTGTSPLRSEFDYWRDYAHWALTTMPHGPDVDTMWRLFDWCERYWPAREPSPSFLWGDPRPSNVLYDDALRISGIVDFENMGIGPAEVDLGWWMANRMGTIELRGSRLPELEGFPDVEGSFAAYEAALGRPLVDPYWFLAFNGARQAAILMRIRAMIRGRGLDMGEMPPVAPAWLLNLTGQA